MKRITILIWLVSFTTLCHAQKDKVKWNFLVKKISDKKYELHVIASLSEGCHIYAQQQPADAIAQPTQLKLQTNPLVKLSGKPKEVGKKELYKNEEVGISSWQYHNTVVFIQPFELKVPVKTNITGVVTYEVCDEKQCYVNQSANFSVKIE